jgi:hypothetical protein
MFSLKALPPHNTTFTFPFQGVSLVQWLHRHIAGLGTLFLVFALPGGLPSRSFLIHLQNAERRDAEWPNAERRDAEWPNAEWPNAKLDPMPNRDPTPNDRTPNDQTPKGTERRKTEHRIWTPKDWTPKNTTASYIMTSLMYFSSWGVVF